MTSTTMHNQWTAPTMLSTWTAKTPTSKRDRTVHRVSMWVKVLDTTAALCPVVTAALCPVVVSAGAIFAAAAWPATAHADSGGDASSSVLSAVGLGANGPVSTAIAQLGQSICPMLVKPGEQFATSASQAQGNSGVGPAIAGVATGMAIQMECPAIMASIANGNLPSLLQLPGTTSAAPSSPLALPGTSPAAPSSPFALPGTSPAAPVSPFALPGTSPAAPASASTSSPFQLPHL